MQPAYMLRRMWRAPGFTVMVLALTVAVVAINATVFSSLWALQWQALPYRDADRLVLLQARLVQFGVDMMLNESLLHQAVADTGVFAGAIGHAGLAPSRATEPDGRRWMIRQVTPDFARVLGVEPVLGRSFAADDAGAGSGLLLSHDQWQRRFDGDQRVLGQTVHLDGQEIPVIGVMPPGFAFPQGDVQAFIAREPDREPVAGTGSLAVVARLADGVAIETARQRLDAILANDEALAGTRANYGLAARVTPLRDTIAGAFTDALQLLALASVLLLLVVAANLASLVQDRILARRREFAIRRAIGARRRDLVATALTDLLVPVLAGSVLATVCVPACIDFLQRRQLLPAESVLGFDATHAQVVTASACSALLVAVVLLVLFASGAFSQRLQAIGERSGVTGLGRLRPALLVAQVALTTALVGSAALLLHSSWRLANEDRGFAAEGVVMTGVDLVAGADAHELANLTDEQRAAWATRVDRLREHMTAHPGVDRVAVASMPPFSGWQYLVSLASADDPGRPVQLHSNTVSSGYFDVLGIPVLAGRDFQDADLGDDSPVIVDALYRSRHLADVDPLTARLPGREGDSAPGARIVGIAGTVRHARLEQETGVPMVYRIAPFRSPTVFFVARTTLPTARVAEEMRALVEAADAGSHVFLSEPLTMAIDKTLVARRAVIDVIGVFGLLTLALACLGLYTVISVMVRRRTAELGVRMALGADQARIRALVLGRGGLLILLGLLLGMPVGLLVADAMTDHLYQVAPHDPLTWMLVAAAVLGTALMACWWPAQRAARMSPVTALQTADGS